MKQLHRLGKVSALLIVSASMGCVLFLTGCVTPVHQLKAAESFAKGYEAFADFSEYEMHDTLDEVVLLEATSIALEPGQRLENDRLVEAQVKFMATQTILEKVFRLIAKMPTILLEDDRQKLWETVTRMKEEDTALDVISGKPINKEVFDEAIVRSTPKEELIRRFAQKIPQLAGQGLDPMRSGMSQAFQSSRARAVEVRRKAAQIIENPEQPLATRLAALDKYKAASEVPYALESMRKRLNAVFSGITEVSNEMAKALQDSSYKKEDLQAFIAKTDEFLTEIEKTISVGKRLFSILVLL